MAKIPYSAHNSPYFWHKEQPNALNIFFNVPPFNYITTQLVCILKHLEWILFADIPSHLAVAPFLKTAARVYAYDLALVNKRPQKVNRCPERGNDVEIVNRGRAV